MGEYRMEDEAEMSELLKNDPTNGLLQYETTLMGHAVVGNLQGSEWFPALPDWFFHVGTQNIVKTSKLEVDTHRSICCRRLACIKSPAYEKERGDE